jgi:voltage-gated potassium channel
MSSARRANFAYLLVGLLVTLLAGPFMAEFTRQSPTLIIQIAFATMLIIGIWSLVESRRWFRVGIILAVSEIAVTGMNAIRPAKFLDWCAIVIALVFCSLSLVFAFRGIARGTRMDANRMAGAICVYLLLGVTLGLLNMLVYLLVPDAFTGLAEDGQRNQGLNLIYYTFVTMTTLGYGDISPVSPFARALAYLAAVAGQFYIAILVGMMVGMYLSERQSSSQ